MGAFRAAMLLAGWSWASPASAEKIACVGDSITFGYGLSNPSTESYPAVLQTLLGTAHTVQNFGVSGCTLLKNGDRPYWDESAFTASDAFAPDVVVVMLGTNDAKPQNWSRKAEFSSDYHDLVDHYRALGALVYVAAPPPVYEPGAFDISPQVVSSEVAPLVEQIASEVNAPLIDVFQALSGRSANFPDTVHPNAEGARLIAETVEAALRQNGFGGATGGGGSGSGGDGGAGGGITAGAASTGLGGSTGNGGGSPSEGQGGSPSEGQGGSPSEGQGGSPSEGQGGSATSGGSDASGSSGPTSDGGLPTSGGSSAVGGAAAGGAAHSGGTIATVTGGSGAGGSGTASGVGHSGGTATATGGSATASSGSNTSGGATAAGGSHAGGVTTQTGGDSFDSEATATGGGPNATGGALPSGGAAPASGETASGGPSGSAASADEEGCGCRFGAGTRPSGPGLAWLLLAWVPMVGRRRGRLD